MEMLAWVAALAERGDITDAARAEIAQFGNPNDPYLGPTLLPERRLPNNYVSEQAVRYLTLIANAGTRYSPAQLKDTGEIVGTFEAMLGHSDVAREFTGPDYDGVRQLVAGADEVNAPASMEAAARLLQWLDRMVVRGLTDFDEMTRWQAIVDALVVRKGDNGYEEQITYPDPANHRVNGGQWSDPDYAIMDDIKAQVKVLTDKGVRPARFVTTAAVRGHMKNNKNIARLVGKAREINGVEYFDGVTNEDINRYFEQEGLPAIEVYDKVYQTGAGSQRFLAEGTFVMTGVSEVEVTIEEELDPESKLYIPNTLGYLGVGRPVGAAAPGRIVRLFPDEHKPPKIGVEAWQITLPVIADPELVAVIKNIT